VQTGDPAGLERRTGYHGGVRERSGTITDLADDLDEEDAALVADGKLRPAEEALPASFWRRPAPRIAAAALLRVLRADRDED
jgi:hypothetical protein